MTSATRPGEGPGARRRLRLPRWWAPAGALVVGVLLGVVLAGLLSGGAVVPGAGQGAGGAASPTPSGSITAGAGGGELLVDPACLQAVNAAQDTLRALDGVGQAAADLDAARLDEIVRELQPVRTRLQQGVTGCSVTTRLPGGSPTSSPPTAPTPTTAPTTAPTGGPPSGAATGSPQR